MATGAFLKRQYIDTGYDWAASSHTFSASGDFTAVSATSKAFVRLANTARTSGGPYSSGADVNNNVFGLTARFTSASAIEVRQELTSATWLGFGLEIWEFIGEAGGANEFVVRAQGEATGDVTGLSGIVDPARCIPFLTGIRSSLASGAALAVHVARNPLISVQHVDISKASPSAASFSASITSLASLSRAGLIATLADAAGGSGYVEHAKQILFTDAAHVFFWSSQGGGALEIALQAIDFGEETTPIVAASPSAVAATGSVGAPTVEVSGTGVAEPAPAVATGSVADPSVEIAGAPLVMPSPAVAAGSVAGPTIAYGGGVIVIPAAAAATGAVAGPDAIVVPVPLAIPAAAVAWGRIGQPVASVTGEPPALPTAAEDLAAEHCAQAWLVLVTIDHDDLEAPFRLTSDAVDTASQGYLFSAVPFQVVLPDDVEARSPRASLRLDNTGQEIIAALRGLADPLRVTLQIVRGADPDVVEREWSGLEWRASSYDVGFITGALGVDDWAGEEFPFETFDQRFAGLWP